MRVNLNPPADMLTAIAFVSFVMIFWLLIVAPKTLLALLGFDVPRCWMGLAASALAWAQWALAIWFLADTAHRIAGN